MTWPLDLLSSCCGLGALGPQETSVARGSECDGGGQQDRGFVTPLLLRWEGQSPSGAFDPQEERPLPSTALSLSAIAAPQVQLPANRSNRSPACNFSGENDYVTISTLLQTPF